MPRTAPTRPPTPRPRPVVGRAASIATLAAEADTIAAHAHHAATTELLVDVLGDIPAVHRVLAADDYPRVVAAVRGLHAAGLDATGTVRSVGDRLHTGHMLTAPALADALHRAARTGTPARPRLVAGLIPDATPGLIDPQTLQALRERYQLIEQRVDAFLDAETAADASWLRAIPRHGGDADRWRLTARLVAAYRDRWGITDTPPLGARPDGTAPHAQQADHRRLTATLTAPHTHSTPVQQGLLTTPRASRSL